MEKLNFWQKLVRSADNITKNAFSARKLTALVIMVAVIVGHGFYYKHCYVKEDFSIYTYVLIIDYCAVAFFLGIVTAEQIIKLKNGKEDATEQN